jgi:hypothetical protein
MVGHARPARAGALMDALLDAHPFVRSGAEWSAATDETTPEDDDDG